MKKSHFFSGKTALLQNFNAHLGPCKITTETKKILKRSKKLFQVRGYFCILNTPLRFQLIFPGGCVTCLLRALIEGQLSALASLAKTENCFKFSPKFVFHFDLEGFKVFLSSLIWKFYYKHSLYFKFLNFPSPCSVIKLALHQCPQRPLHTTPRKANSAS